MTNPLNDLQSELLHRSRRIAGDEQQRDDDGKFGSGGGGGVGPSNEEKIKNAATMYGSGSKQHKDAQKRFGGGGKKADKDKISFPSSGLGGTLRNPGLGGSLHRDPAKEGRIAAGFKGGTPAEQGAISAKDR